MREVVLEGRGEDWIAYAVGRVNLRHVPVELVVADEEFATSLDGGYVSGPLTIQRKDGGIERYHDRVVIVRRASAPPLPRIVIDELVARMAAEGGG